MPLSPTPLGAEEGLVRVQAVAGPEGNTVRAADGDPSAWTYSPEGAFDSRRPGGELWGLPPEIVGQTLGDAGGFDGSGRFAPWEGYRSAPALRTEVGGLPPGDYHVFLLWQTHAQQSCGPRAGAELRGPALRERFTSLPPPGAGRGRRRARG